MKRVRRVHKISSCFKEAPPRLILHWFRLAMHQYTLALTLTCPTSSRGSLEVSDKQPRKIQPTTSTQSTSMKNHDSKIILPLNWILELGVLIDFKATYERNNEHSRARTVVSSSLVINSFLSVRKTASIHSHNTFRFFTAYALSWSIKFMIFFFKS